MKKFLIYIIGIGCFLSPFRMWGQARLEISNEVCRQMACESNKSLQVADNNQLNAEIEKQPHLITGAAVGGTGMLNTKLKHPAGVILKTLNGENVMSF